MSFLVFHMLQQNSKHLSYTISSTTFVKIAQLLDQILYENTQTFTLQ